MKIFSFSPQNSIRSLLSKDHVDFLSFVINIHIYVYLNKALLKIMTKNTVSVTRARTFAILFTVSTSLALSSRVKFSRGRPRDVQNVNASRSRECNEIAIISWLNSRIGISKISKISRYPFFWCTCLEGRRTIYRILFG